MEESKTRVPFFTRFLEFGRTLDQELFKLKDDFSAPPRQRPHNYDRGIMELRNETKALKEEMAQVRTKLEEIRTFASFIEITKEMTDQQAVDLKKMEAYLTKYGYKPMEIQEPVNNHLEKQGAGDTDASLETEESKPSTPPWEKGSPLLSDITRNIMMGKELPVFKSQVNPEGTQFEIRARRYQLAENMGKTKELVVTSPIITKENLQTEQSSLYEMHNLETSLCITPEVVCQGRPKCQPFLQTRVTSSTKPDYLLGSSYTQVQDSKNRMPTAPVTEVTANIFTGKGNSNVFSSQTPEEPVLTTERNVEMFRMGCDNEITPEEPVLEFQKNVGRQHNTTETSKTPEEPALLSVVAQRTVVGSYIAQVPKKTPEEPVLAYHRSVTQYRVDCESNKTPEVPVLSKSGSRVLENITPEEPLMSSNYMRAVDPTRLVQKQIPPNKCDLLRSPSGGISGSEEQGYGVDFPESPELSDVTLNILSLTNSYNNKSSSFPCRDLYDVKTRKVQQGASQDSRRTCVEQDKNLLVAHDNEGSSVRADCCTEKSLLYSALSKGDKNRALGRHKWAGSHFSTLSELPPSPELSDITMNILQGSHRAWKSRNSPGREFNN